MLKAINSRRLEVGEIETATGRALVEERYLALRRQIPIIYVIALVNLAGIELGVTGSIGLGPNIPTVLIFASVCRILWWSQARLDLDHRAMLSQLRQTCWVCVGISLLVAAWCVGRIVGNPESTMAVMAFGSLTAIGVSYGLGPLPLLARLPLLLIALPLAVIGFLSQDLQSFCAGATICIVSMLMIRLLDVNNAHFTDLVRSRAVIASQQQAAEAARREAIEAATTDFLTGLSNRRAFVAALESAVELRDERPFAVGILDLNRFKQTNDTFGHATGDRLLVTVAERLLEAAGPDSVVARLGGDEFGIILRNVGDAPVVRRQVDAMLSRINRPADVDGRPFAVSVCCGIALSSLAGGGEPSSLLAAADVALYKAKDRSGATLAMFKPEMEAPQRRRVRIERALQLSQVNDNIDVAFQPIVDLASGEIVAVEALARWTDDDLGVVSPSEFIPIAEQLNLIGPLSGRLMQKAFAQAAVWPRPVRLSFNLSAVQLCTPDAADEVLSALELAGLETGRLQVEVTETALLRDFDHANRNLARLRDAGVMIVLDDFGAGYASIGYLKQLRFDQIKLDGDLLASALHSVDAKRLLSAVIGLCHALGVGTIAEHVESERQLELLKTLGCTAGQGYWLGEPLGESECRNSLTAPKLAWRSPRSRYWSAAA